MKNVSTVEDLPKIPILSRDLIQRNLLLSNGINKRRIRYDSTSGSTGQPLRFIKDQQSSEGVKIATELLFNKWAGLNFGERHVQLWAYHTKSFYQNVWFKYLYNCRQFPPYYNTFDAFHPILEKIQSLRPNLLTGYSSALFLAASLIEEEDYNLNLPLKGIIASAESLLPYQKKFIETIFQTDVLMRYGAREVDNVGMECPERNGYHFIPSRYILEVVDSEGNLVNSGEEGRLLVTDLLNHIMPLIRYDIGDYAILSDELCSCGRKWPLIKEIKGRISDHLELPSGKSFPFLSFNVLFEQVSDFIREFQVLQKSTEKWVIKIVIAPNFRKKQILELERTLKEATNNEVDISLELVKKIQRTSTGKFKYIIRMNELSVNK